MAKRWVLGLLLLGAVAAATSVSAAPPRPLAVLHPDRGTIDQSFTLSPDGGTLFFVVNDGARSELRAVALRPESRGGRPGLGLTPIATMPDVDLDTRELLALPGDRVLTLAGKGKYGPRPGRVTVYSVRSQPPLQARLDPARSLILGAFRDRPALLAFSYPDCKLILHSDPPQVVQCPPEPGDGYELRAYDLQDLRLLSSRRYPATPSARKDMDQRTGDVETPLGRARPLYFLDDYRTMDLIRFGGHSAQMR